MWAYGAQVTNMQNENYFTITFMFHDKTLLRDIRLNRLIDMVQTNEQTLELR